ncbi:MAG: pyrroline-5-carboxylate reductase [Luteolibacter sp.]
MKVGIIGCGKMGTALIQGAVQTGVVNPQRLKGIDPVAAAREQFVEATGGCASERIADLADSDMVLLCTKPQQACETLNSLAQVAADQPMLIISVAAGISVAALEAAAGPSMRVIRCMPNTPALVGKGAAAYCMGNTATSEDAENAQSLLGSVGLALELPESMMDAVTGLSGSGPAYVYLMIESLAEGGVKQGLSWDQALQLATQTVLGAAVMVQETGKHPKHLREMVTSPNGTTLAGLSALEERDFVGVVHSAVIAATARSKELGR